MREMRMLLLSGLLTVTACGGDDGDNETAEAEAARLTAEGTATAGLLAPIRSLSMAAVEFADLASQRAGTLEVRQYAQTVAADHRALIGVLDSVAEARSATLTETRETQEMANTARMAHSGLENLTGAAFDLPFVRAEVESHRLLLDRLEQQLIPSATLPDLRTLLTDIQAMADAHLARARQLLAQQLGQSAEPQTERAPSQVPRPPQVPPPSPVPPPALR
jgi:putative membrane protein